jgi:hypothetical protein
MRTAQATLGPFYRGPQQALVLRCLEKTQVIRIENAHENYISHGLSPWVK